uniref:Uncharacterized protein n=1 Tax=Rhizophora mucronata TaxID=61149 RepID=A0A2P2Q672_RHIMU
MAPGSSGVSDSAVKGLEKCMQSCGGNKTEKEYKLNTCKGGFDTQHYILPLTEMNEFTPSNKDREDEKEKKKHKKGE